jgi:hypothetical protein
VSHKKTFPKDFERFFMFLSEWTEETSYERRGLFSSVYIQIDTKGPDVRKTLPCTMDVLFVETSKAINISDIVCPK